MEKKSYINPPLSLRQYIIIVKLQHDTKICMVVLLRPLHTVENLLPPISLTVLTLISVKTVQDHLQDNFILIRDVIMNQKMGSDETHQLKEVKHSSIQAQNYTETRALLVAGSWSIDNLKVILLEKKKFFFLLCYFSSNINHHL